MTVTQHLLLASTTPKKEIKQSLKTCKLFPGGSDGKESACNVGDLGVIPGLGDPLEMEMATHSSILSWKIPWTEEPGGVWSIGSERVGHD